MHLDCARRGADESTPAAAKPTTAATGRRADHCTPAAAAANPTTAPTSQDAQPPPPLQASSGGTATLPIGADPTLNPWHPNAFVESLFVNRVLFGGLAQPGKDLNPAPDLAASGRPPTTA